MKKDDIMKYRKNIAYGVTGVALASFMITGIHMQTDAKSNKAKFEGNISAEVKKMKIKVLIINYQVV